MGEPVEVEIKTFDLENGAWDLNRVHGLNPEHLSKDAYTEGRKYSFNSGKVVGLVPVTDHEMKYRQKFGLTFHQMKDDGFCLFHCLGVGIHYVEQQRLVHGKQAAIAAVGASSSDAPVTLRKRHATVRRAFGTDDAQNSFYFSTRNAEEAKFTLEKLRELVLGVPVSTAADDRNWAQLQMWYSGGMRLMADPYTGLMVPAKTNEQVVALQRHTQLVPDYIVK